MELTAQEGPRKWSGWGLPKQSRKAKYPKVNKIFWECVFVTPRGKKCRRKRLKGLAMCANHKKKVDSIPDLPEGMTFVPGGVEIGQAVPIDLTTPDGVVQEQARVYIESLRDKGRDPDTIETVVKTLAHIQRCIQIRDELDPKKQINKALGQNMAQELARRISNAEASQAIAAAGFENLMDKLKRQGQVSGVVPGMAIPGAVAHIGKLDEAIERKDEKSVESLTQTVLGGEGSGESAGDTAHLKIYPGNDREKSSKAEGDVPF